MPTAKRCFVVTKCNGDSDILSSLSTKNILIPNTLHTEHLLGKFIREVKANHYIDTFGLIRPLKARDSFVRPSLPGNSSQPHLLFRIIKQKNSSETWYK